MACLALMALLVFLAIPSTLQDLKIECRSQSTRELCPGVCCGYPETYCLLHSRTCAGRRCSKSSECGTKGCCRNGICTEQNCDHPKASTTAWYVIALPAIGILLVVSILVAICWVKYRRAAYPNTSVMSTIGRAGPTHGFDDTVPLPWNEVGGNQEEAQIEGEAGKNAPKEKLNFPP